MSEGRGRQIILGRLRVLLANAVWIVPVLATICAFALASAVSRMDYTTPWRVGGLFTTGGADGARDLVQTVASTSMTVSTLVISATIVVLQIAGSQYSPRLPGQFMRDKTTQFVIGVFVFTFIYSLSTVRSIAADENFVPNFAVTICFVLIIASVLAFIYYIHHVVQSVRIETILSYIERQTTRAAERTYAERGEGDGDPNRADGRPPIPEHAQPILATRSGIVQQLDADKLVDFAAEHDVVICFTKRLGDHVAAGTPLGWVWRGKGGGDALGSAGEVHAEARKVIQLGHERDLENDAAFGLTQLTDIALRALSPAINDPTTGCNALQAAEAVLVRLADLHLGDRCLVDGEGVCRAIVPQHSFEQMVDQVVTPVRCAASNDIAIVRRLCELLANLARHAPDEEQRDCVAEQIERLLRASNHAITESHDRNVIAEAGREVDLALAGKPPELT